MKISIFYGSIHKERGNTYVIIDEFQKSAKAAGADVDVVFLAEKKIKNCAACLTCWTRTPGRCVIKDDMSELLDMFMASDIVVMATPVYVHNVTGIMKTFIDRIIPIIDPHLVKMDTGYTGHIKRHASYPDIGVIATGAFPEQQCTEFVSQYFHRLSMDLYSNVVFEIYKSQAILLKMGDKTPLAPLVDDYKATVRTAAKEVVENLKISDETQRALDRQFIPDEIYIQEANKYWDSRIARYEKK